MAVAPSELHFAPKSNAIIHTCSALTCRRLQPLLLPLGPCSLLPLFIQTKLQRSRAGSSSLLLQQHVCKLGRCCQAVALQCMRPFDRLRLTALRSSRALPISFDASSSREGPPPYLAVGSTRQKVVQHFLIDKGLNVAECSYMAHPAASSSLRSMILACGTLFLFAGGLGRTISPRLSFCDILSVQRNTNTAGNFRFTTLI